MTLRDMKAGEVGVVLVTPLTARALHLGAGAHMRLVAQCSDTTLVEVEGKAILFSCEMAEKMLLLKYFEE